MPRIERHDAPGSWHHVSNGGIAQRSIFETETDFRYFLAQIADAVRRGEIEVHGYCLLANHFHVQARSLRGEGGLSTAMRRIQSAYARRFNKMRQREGPLFAPRFWSERVDTHGYRRQLTAYLDSNVVDAGLATRAVDYEYCSAYAVARGCAPSWLATWWIEALLAEEAADLPCPIDRYLSVFPARPAKEGTAGWIQQRCERARANQPDEYEQLAATTPAGIDRWLRRNAIAADGPQRARPALPAATVLSRFRNLSLPADARRDAVAATSVTAALDNRSMLVAALRVLARIPQQEIGARLGVGRGVVRIALQRHRRNMQQSEQYASAFAVAVHGILRPES